eukprot:CAMPEP_0202408874 /NCGR_PEP_ID=MMETSP1128-20130828/15775_1 /ASSEMBLY_ACC=CAM_ASM_000463 /TAXON_ID=3047 /ORGANISM="Dunaliella tertiolecta, Strain CCMP1320" /LENGTH=120 /DNA_ID=CAMNT_0049014103 /DNA_START=458 /DNA_END=816 /DNA_ORIENTATION=-
MSPLPAPAPPATAAILLPASNISIAPLPFPTPAAPIAAQTDWTAQPAPSAYPALCQTLLQRRLPSKPDLEAPPAHHHPHLPFASAYHQPAPCGSPYPSSSLPSPCSLPCPSFSLLFPCPL